MAEEWGLGLRDGAGGRELRVREVGAVAVGRGGSRGSPRGAETAGPERRPPWAPASLHGGGQGRVSADWEAGGL